MQDGSITSFADQNKETVEEEVTDDELSTRDVTENGGTENMQA